MKKQIAALAAALLLMQGMTVWADSRPQVKRPEPPSRQVEVKVVDKKGLAVADLLVENGEGFTRTGPEGKATLSCPVGKEELTISDPRQDARRTVSLTVEEGTGTQTARTVVWTEDSPLQAARKHKQGLEITIIDENGDPLPGAEVWICSQAGQEARDSVPELTLSPTPRADAPDPSQVDWSGVSFAPMPPENRRPVLLDETEWRHVSDIWGAVGLYNLPRQWYWVQVQANGLSNTYYLDGTGSGLLDMTLTLDGVQKAAVVRQQDSKAVWSSGGAVPPQQLTGVLRRAEKLQDGRPSTGNNYSIWLERGAAGWESIPLWVPGNEESRAMYYDAREDATYQLNKEDTQFLQKVVK